MAGAELLASVWFSPSEDFALCSFVEEGDLVVEESEESVLSYAFTCENITADESEVVRRVVLEFLEIFHGDTWKSIDV